jgi:hypothetical protein
VDLSEESIQRLARLGYTTEAELKYWRDLLQSAGEPIFAIYLGKMEESIQEYHHWFPRLQAFAAECRQKVPVPGIDSFLPIEREQYRILLAKMKEFAASGDRRCVLERKPNFAAILSTTRVD